MATIEQCILISHQCAHTSAMVLASARVRGEMRGAKCEGRGARVNCKAVTLSTREHYLPISQQRAHTSSWTIVSTRGEGA